MSDPFNAARLGDPIEHSQTLTGLVLGLAAGALIGVAIVMTGGAALVAGAAIGSIAGATALTAGATIVGTSVAAGGVGMALGSLSPTRSQTGGSCIASGSPTVLIQGSPAARASDDFADCAGPSLFGWNPIPHDHKLIAQGSGTVKINGKPAARTGDKTVCDAIIGPGAPTVFIGGCTMTTEDIQGELPREIGWTLTVLGIASGLVLMPPLALIGSVAGSMGVGVMGGLAAQVLFPNSEDAQILGGLLGSILGGRLGAGLGTMGTQWLTAQTMFGELPPNVAAFLAGGFRNVQLYGVVNGWIQSTLPELNVTVDPARPYATFSGPGAFGAAGALGPDGKPINQILNGTAGGARVQEFIDLFGKNLHYDLEVLIWDAISARFLEAMPDGGTLNAYVGGGAARDASTFIRIELPIALAKGMNIVFHFLDTPPKDFVRSPWPPPPGIIQLILAGVGNVIMQPGAGAPGSRSPCQ